MVFFLLILPKFKTNTCTQVYELERDRDIQATATQAAQDAMEKARKRAANLERRNEELERSIAAQKTEHGRLTMDNASLQAEVQRLQKRLTENLKKVSLLEATSSSSTAMSSLSQSSEAVPPAHRSGTPAHIREAENESRQQTLQELARLREQVHDLTTRLATRNNINSGLEVTERAALQQQLENMRATAMQQQLTSTARVRDLEQALAVAEARLEGIRHERDSALAEVSKIRVEWKELHVQLAKARVRAANEGDARVRAEADCDGLRRQLELVDPSRSALEASSLSLLQRDRGIMEGQQQKQYHRGGASSFASPSRAAAPNRVAMSPQQALVLSEQRNALLRRRANEAEVKAKTVERVLQRMIVTEAPQKEAFVM